MLFGVTSNGYFGSGRLLEISEAHTPLHLQKPPYLAGGNFIICLFGVFFSFKGS